MNHGTTHTERMRIFLAAAVAVAMLVAIMLAAASAQGGSGGVGTGGGGNDSGGDRYSRIWDKFSNKNHKWAHRTSDCESGGQPHIHGGGGAYHGAFQFMKSTWKSSPKSPGGDPHTYAWKTQAVVAVKLKKRDGAGHWPNCG
ncbi:MAG: transglycosylase family protein [bacterium]